MTLSIGIPVSVVAGLAMLGAAALLSGEPTPQSRSSVAAGSAPPQPGPRLTGINLAGGEFKPGRRPGVYGKDYIYPRPADLAPFAQAGMNVVRLPFRWERVQPELAGPLSVEEMQRLDAVVRSAKQQQMQLILDVHNYARYAGRSVAEPAVADGLVDLWTRLAERYRHEPVAFGLMNEPNGIAAADWRRIVDRVVAAIRRTGARNLILVPGVRWTGAHSWARSGGGDSNAAAFADFRDPGSNFAFEMHQYLDRDSSGTHSECGGPETGVERLRAATVWLRSVHARGFLGEFGAGRDAECLATLDRMLAFMDHNGDVWIGWTYWTAGPWWPEEYAFSVQPTRDGNERPQMQVLRAHLAR